MNRPLLGFCLAILLSLLAPSPALRAQGPQGYGSAEVQHKHWWSWFHREKHPKEEKHAKEKKHHKEKLPPLYTTPKKLSWWRGGGPSPMGAGAK